MINENKSICEAGNFIARTWNWTLFPNCLDILTIIGLKTPWNDEERQTGKWKNVMHSQECVVEWALRLNTQQNFLSAHPDK